MLICLESVKSLLCPVKLCIGVLRQIAVFFLGGGRRNVHKYRVIVPRRNQQDARKNWMRSFNLYPLYQISERNEKDWVCVIVKR